MPLLPYTYVNKIQSYTVLSFSNDYHIIPTVIIIPSRRIYVVFISINYDFFTIVVQVCIGSYIPFLKSVEPSDDAKII